MAKNSSTKLLAMNLIVNGGRDFNDYELLKEKLNSVVQEVFPEPIIVLSGCANGADKLAEQAAEFLGLTVIRFPAEWKKYGRNAGPIRNLKMVNYCTPHKDRVLSFWDGQSKGTKDLIDKATDRNLKTRIIKYKP